MRKMTDLPQEQRLKPDQLRSMTECEQAINAIAKKTGKSPLDIWRVNEIELSEQASKVDWDIDRNRLWLVLVNLFVFGVIVNYYLVSDWPRVVGFVALFVFANFMVFICRYKPTWIPSYGKFLLAFAEFVFSLALTLFGYDLADGKSMHGLILILSMLGISLAAFLVRLLNCFPELLWSHSVKEWNDRGEQLSALRSVRALLAGGSDSAVESRSSVVSYARLRAVVDWD